MNTPVTATFFKKIELYQEIIALNKIFQKDVWNFDNGAKNTWEVEKKVLYWTRLGHKHLGSAIDAPDFREGGSRLKSFRLTSKEVHDVDGGGQYWLMNLVQRGFAEKSKDKEGKDNGILITPTGLLTGAVLNDIYKLKQINKQKLWHKKFWSTYGTKYQATHFLARRYRYYLYWFFVKTGWLLFIVGAFLLIRSLFR
jgi:hypothetical protein